MFQNDRSRDVAAASSATEPPGSVGSAAVSILIVDDEPLIRMIATELLGGAGYSVFDAGDADEAIRILTAQGGATLLFTDVDMPGERDGIALAWMVRQCWPECRILVSSGRPVTREDLPPGHSRFLPKPWLSLDLLSTVAGLLG